MKKLACLIILLVLVITGCAPYQTVSVDNPNTAYWPTTEWQNSSPEAQGMDSLLLAQMLEDIVDNQTNIYSVMVIRNGYLVADAYFHPYTRDTKVHIQSVTKSVIGMLVGRAIQMGAVKSADETLVSFFPGRVFINDSQAKEAIRLSHLLSMTSGLDCQEFSATGSKMEQSSGWVQFMLDLPVESKPGTKFGYCNGNAHLLSAILEKTTTMNAREFANQELFGPLGIPVVDEADWGSDPKGYSIGGYGLHLRPVDLAKLALLALQNGKWEDQQMLAANWMAESTTQKITKEDGSGYGYLWTVYPKQGRYAALGLGGQQIHVYPAKNLIVVVTAGLPSYAEAPEIEKMLTGYILPSVKSDTPLQENPQGLARLLAGIQTAANPALSVAALPATVLEISGKVYNFAENPFGWQNLQIVFTPDTPTAKLYFNDSAALEVGLDNLYRLSDSPLLGKVLLRARWVDDQTLVADYPYPISGPTKLGELGETEMRFYFSGEQLEVTIKPLIFGGESITIIGKR
jgi:CubicO group peptidase (beta-lactamase class C family)